MKYLQEKIESLEKEVQELKSKKNISAIKKNLTVGDTFEVAGLVWKILEIKEKGYVCLAERLKEDMQFDSSCNDWKFSKLRKYLNEDFYEKLAKEIEEQNIVQFERELISLDGQTEYGVCEDKVSLISLDEYRKYRKLIPNTEDYSWWTLTPDSTKCNGDTYWVRYVSSSGDFNNGGYDYDRGVRPFCIFSSAIFESEEE
jgi:hypothetical protein